MVTANNQLEAAIKAGNLDQAKALYEPARVQYERIEPIAELFPDSDAATDSRADDFPLKEQDPGFTGWHKVEYILFSQNTLDGAEPVMAQLQKDIQTLVTTINALTIDPATMINGSAGLIEEASKTKITGEEERYAHTDLATLQANVDGAKEIIDLNATLLKGANASLYDTIEASFTAINTGLAKYKNADGTYQTYDKLTDADRASLQAELATLSENLSMVAGAFGLEVK
jgi:iron uptake system component EfeO